LTVAGQHARWKDGLSEKRATPEYEAAYEEARRSYELGKAIRERRLALGITQTELAARAGMTQSAVSRLEVGGMTPTIGLLDRVAAALDADLIVAITPHAA
jgi:ribosome-binding protein aMBF1 (putative translation factor)